MSPTPRPDPAAEHRRRRADEVEQLARHLEARGHHAAATIVRQDVDGAALLVDRDRFLEPLTNALDDPVTRRGLETGDTTVIVIVPDLVKNATAALENAGR